MTVDGAQHELATGTSIDIPVGADHRIENASAEGVVMVEVQRGDYFGEDDIVRIDDDYGRAGPL